jgi:predicted N-acyltransferase
MKDTDYTQKGFTVTIHNHIDELNRKEWDDLVHDTMFHTVQWMGLLERSVREDITPYYVAVKKDENLVGAGVCYSSSKVLLRVRFPCIACTYPFSENMSLFIKEGEDDFTIFTVLYDALERIARKEKAQMMFIAYVSDSRYLNYLKKKGFSLLKQMPLTYLDVKWKTFKEYLGSLPRKAKKNIRHTLNKGKRQGLRLEHSHDFSGSEELFNLYSGALDRYRHENIVPFTPAFYKNLETYVREYAYILRCYHNDDLVGHWMYFFDGNLASMTLSGVREDARDYNAYFNICYDAVREMIEKGCKKILFGAATYEVKRRIGCSMRRTIVSVKFQNPILNVALQLLTIVRNIWTERKFPLE